MSMKDMSDLFALGITLVLLGGLVTIISFAMLPSVIQSGNDLQNSEISGVTLTTSQSNLVSNMLNIVILLFIFIGVIVMIVGFLILFGKIGKGRK